MAKGKRTVGLIAFLKGVSDPKTGMPGCANLDHHSSGCSYGNVCLVQTGKRCRYFEKVVLPTSGDIGLRESVYSQYRKHVGLDGNGELGIGPLRRCDCGAELKQRKRYCDHCASKRRRETYRKSRSKRNT